MDSVIPVPIHLKDVDKGQEIVLEGVWKKDVS